MVALTQNPSPTPSSPTARSTLPGPFNPLFLSLYSPPSLAKKFAIWALLVRIHFLLPLLLHSARYIRPPLRFSVLPQKPRRGGRAPGAPPLYPPLLRTLPSPSPRPLNGKPGGRSSCNELGVTCRGEMGSRGDERRMGRGVKKNLNRHPVQCEHISPVQTHSHSFAKDGVGSAEGQKRKSWFVIIVGL